MLFDRNVNQIPFSASSVGITWQSNGSSLTSDWIYNAKRTLYAYRTGKFRTKSVKFIRQEINSRIDLRTPLRRNVAIPSWKASRIARIGRMERERSEWRIRSFPPPLPSFSFFFSAEKRKRDLFKRFSTRITRREYTKTYEITRQPSKKKIIRLKKKEKEKKREIRYQVWMRGRVSAVVQ